MGFAGITGLVLICRLLSANGQRTHMSDAPRFSGAYLHLWRAALKRLFMDSGELSSPPPGSVRFSSEVPGGCPLRCRRARSVYNVLPSRQTQCRVRAEAGVHQHGRSFTDRPSTSRGSHGFLAPPGTHGVLRQRRSDDPQSVAVLSGGCLLASRPDRTNKDSLLGSKQADPWVRGTYHESIGFLRGGSAMTRKPRPAGSDRQVRCSSPVHPDDRSRLT